MKNSKLTKQGIPDLGFSPKKNTKQFPPELEFECTHKYRISGKHKICIKCGDKI